MPKFFFILVVILVSGKLLSQNSIEKYLGDQQLVTPQQLKKYYQKKESDDSYVRMMIKLMKKDKETSVYVLQMEKEYKAEQAKAMMNNDTLAILLDILTPSCDKKHQFENDTIIEDKNLQSNLSEFIIQLTKKRLITNRDAEKINSTIQARSLYDSCSLVSLAINHKNIALITTTSKLLELMDTLKNLKILSDENYKKLIATPLPDSVSKIRYILSFCEKTFISGKGSFIRDEQDFFSRINALSKLSNLDVSDVKLELITIYKDSSYLRAIPVIKAVFNGRQFTHECYEVATSQKEFEPYSLSGHDYYKIFNRIFAHNRSEYRIYEIKEKNPMQWMQGFIILTEEQWSALYHIEQLELSYEENKKPLSFEQILKAIDIYKKSGLLKKVHQNSIDSVIDDIKQNPVFRYNELIGRFSAISVTINEKIPLSESQAIYLLKKMAAISNYEFNPQTIRFEKSINGKLTLLFYENGVTQRHEFDLYIDWQGIWGLVHNVIYNNPDRKGYFQSLRFEQNKETYIYATSEQMKILKKEKVINDY